MQDLSNQLGVGIKGFKVHTRNLFEETIHNAIRPKDRAALEIPLRIFLSYMDSLRVRCSELNDPVLDKIMCDMALYDQADQTNKEYYDPDILEEVDRRFMEYRKYLKG